MSNQDQYLKLWQQKRSELQVNANPQADWLAMNHLLDQQMPVSNNNAGNTNTGSNLAKQLSHFAKFKLLYVAAALITAAAITYVAIQHRTAIKNNKHAKTEIRADSVLNNTADTVSIDSALQDNELTDSTANKETPTNAVDTNGADATGNLGSDKSIGGKNSVDVNDNSINPVPDKNSIAKNNSNKSRNSSSGRNPVNGNANNSRLLSSANKINNGLALTGNSVNRSRGSGVSTTNNRRLSGNNTEQASNDGRQSQGANIAAANGSNNGQIPDNNITDNAQQTNSALLQLLPSPFMVNKAPLSVNNYTIAGTANKANIAKATNTIAQYKAAKTQKAKTPSNSNLDWGILFAVNSNGSFTPKNENKNIYGSLPVDAYTGLFATYNLSSKWAVDMQVKLLVPEKVSGGYNHDFSTRNDTGQVVTQTYKITDTRKIYSAQIPLHLVYNITKNISVKAGPVFNLPIKHFGASSLTATTDTVIDSIGYAGRLVDTIGRITLKRRLGVGISGGISINYKRIRLEAVYYRSPPYKISSPAGSYSPAVNNIQISLGFKLNRTKLK
jgi:hypothetical protein